MQGPFDFEALHKLASTFSLTQATDAGHRADDGYFFFLFLTKSSKNAVVRGERNNGPFNAEVACVDLHHYWLHHRDSDIKQLAIPAVDGGFLTGLFKAQFSAPDQTSSRTPRKLTLHDRRKDVIIPSTRQS